MAIEPIDPFSDSRVTHETAKVNGYTYHYILGVPQNGQYKATVFLIHGWPDLSIGWRYQIPFLISLGLRVVAPDLMGFGGTVIPPNSIHLYGFKRAADDIAELAKQLGCKQIILGGHDWGGMVVWRTALWHPELISHVFSICTPYAAPQKKYISTEQLVQGPMPQAAYQLQLAGPDVEAALQSEEDMRIFFNMMSGGRGPNGEVGFSPERGVHFEDLKKLKRGPLLDEKTYEFYVQQYSRNGLHGTLNWYRTREANYKDDLNLPTDRIEMPALFIQANYDSILKPSMAVGMDKYFTQLTRADVDAQHFCQVTHPDKINAILKNWLDGVVFGGKSTL
ncbi:hypothetical protein W97_03737 [Coniosporium apollinis CBS 100218]|uniref:AB hydrolase-1 domain-containing protein n=1 Tax=Coniosporium apollinis (strain CBS 100218) TaxID=1168221 RepID=R7YRQ7_CONA1|nr:uncharacterized protein W97_03737 [Coniosporium apollinis CBS 100218]EON64504.1 hypothetical protein W97_03737 [Coniosporium apollinis CBS 100218]